MDKILQKVLSLLQPNPQFISPVAANQGQVQGIQSPQRQGFSSEDYQHEGGPDRPITDAVYKQSAELVAALCKRYSIPFDRVYIRKHSEIKPTQCPGTLDIDRLVREAKALSEGENPQQIIDRLRKELDDLDRQKKEWEQKAINFEGKYNQLKYAVTKAKEFLNAVKL